MNSTSEVVRGARPLVVVTGGTGFIGSHLVDRLLHDGCRVRYLVRRGSPPTWRRSTVETCHGDLRDADACKRLIDGADLIYHLAGAGLRRLRHEREANDRACDNLLDAWRGSDASLVFLSSIKAGIAKRLPVDSAISASHAYGQSKLRCEMHIRAISREQGRSACIVRAPLVYGPRDLNLLPLFRLARYGLLPLLHGAPLAQLSQIYVGDLVDMLAQCRPGTPRTVEMRDIESNQRCDWNAVVHGIAHWHGGRPRMTLPVQSLHALRGILQRWKSFRPHFCQMALVRLSDLLDGQVAFSSLNEGQQNMTDLAKGLERTGRWYQSMGWI